MARPRKATATKELQGTLRPCRTNENEPVPDINPPVKPVTLTVGQDHFDLLVSRLDAENRASASHTEIVALAARLYAEMGIKFSVQYAALYRGCLNDLGLTPASASKVSAKKKEPVKVNKFAV